jgi:hypothetical protein
VEGGHSRKRCVALARSIHRKVVRVKVRPRGVYQGNDEEAIRK